MIVLQSFLIAISMYSIIPVPGVKWDEKNMRYCMNAFPVIGLIIGFLLFLFHAASEFFGLPQILTALGYTLIPIFITGGIHLDGYMDTVDALASHRTPEEKRKILKDPNVGAFSVIHLVCLILITFCLWYCLPGERFDPVLITLGFVFSRCLSGLSVLSFPKAEGTGLVSMFADAGNTGEKGNGADLEKGYRIDTVNKERKGKISRVKVIQEAECLITGAALCLKGWIGGVITITCVIIYLWYRRMSRKEFGGLNGDQAGWFLSITEVWITAVIVVIKSVILR